MCEITKEYLERFPAGLRDCLQSEEEMKKFSESVFFDYDDRKVYRAIHNSNKVVPNDFLGNADTAKVYGTKVATRNLKKYIFHSVSVNDDINQLIKSFRDFPSEYLKLNGIAEGIMSARYGPADFSDYTSHHNWYLYKDSQEEVARQFKVVDIPNKEKD